MGIFIDIETYSSNDLNAVGVYKYVEAADFEILLLAYADDESPIYQVDFTAGEELPDWLTDILLHPAPGWIKYAVNASFEIVCLFEHFFRKGLLQSKTEADFKGFMQGWQDTALLTRYAGFPGGLEAAGAALKLTEAEAKSRTGNALIKFFSVPRKPSKRDPRTRNKPQQFPEKWDAYKAYNKQDVTAERALHRSLPNIAVPEFMQDQFRQDLLMQLRGVAVDIDMINNAIRINNIYTDRIMDEAVEITDLANPNSRNQLLGWLESEGVGLPGLTKEDVSAARRVLKDVPEQADAYRMLGIRQDLAKSSVAKYSTAKACTCHDGRARGLLQFYGASRTGRWAGRLIQLQNLPRAYMNMSDQKLARRLVKRGNGQAVELLFRSLPDTLSQIIRTSLVPGKGYRFVDADYSAIEARVIAWYAGEDWVLDVFRTHGKIYEATASQMFGIELDTIVKGHPNYSYRARGKVATLALGFAGGVSALVKMHALDDGIPEEELPGIVSKWRKSNPKIARMWKTIESAALQAMKSPNTPIGTHKLYFMLDTTNPRGIPFLVVQLPSTRRLYYAYPYIDPNGQYGPRIMYKQQIGKAFIDQDTYGGKLTENIVQATARDILAEAVLRVEAAGLRPVFHVHDELICERPIQGDPEAQLEQIRKLMTINPAWAPDLPLNAEGWTGDFFTKD